MSTSWNKITQPDSTSAWSLIPDIQNAIKTATVVIGIASDTEQTNLPTLAPGSVLPVPTVICRTDKASFPLYVWDGTVWNPVRNGATVGYLNVAATGTGFSSGEFLIDAITPVAVIAGHKYEVTYRMDNVFTTGASNAFVLNFKTSLTSDTGTTGTNFQSGTFWSAPVSNSGNTTEYIDYFECSTTGNIRFSVTTGRVAGSSLYNISNRRFIIKDAGYI